jgi:radical SAM protein with 4Fe4S-binding SPASM domain
MQTLGELEANHFPYGLRLTAVPPFDRLLEDVRFLCENTHPQHLQVEPAFHPERGGGYQYELEEGLQFLQAFFAAQRLAKQYGQRLGCVGSDVDKITAVPCGSPFNSLIVTPQNKLVACFEITDDSHPLAELTTIGQITSQGVEIDDEARSNLWQKMVERRNSCRDCFCYWTCAGGCLPRTLSPGPSGHLEHGVHCEMRRILLQEMLLKQIASGNGLRKRTPRRSAAGEVSTLAGKNP